MPRAVSRREQGLWRACVDSVELQARRTPRFSGPAPQVGRPPARAFEPQLHLVVGDQSGARTEITVPYDRRCPSARPRAPPDAAQGDSPGLCPRRQPQLPIRDGVSRSSPSVPRLGCVSVLCGSSNSVSI